MKFDFNLYSALLLPAVIQGIIYAVLLWRRSKAHENKSDFFLSLLCLYSVFHISQWMLGFAGWYDVKDIHTLFVFYFPFKNWFILGPLLYYFVVTRTNHAFEFKRKDIFHFIPGLLYYAYALFCILHDIVWLRLIKGVPLEGFEGTRGYFAQQNFGILETPITVLSFLLLIFYIIKSLLHYRGYKEHIINEHSNVEEVSIKWLRNILYALISAFILAIIFIIATTFMPNLNYISAWWIYLVWAIITFYISIAGYNDNSHLNTSIRYSDSIEMKTKVDDRVADDLPKIDLKKIASQDKSYLKPNLNLNDFAKQAGIPSAQVSKILNSKYNQNFNEFINTFRIEEVKSKLNAPNYSHYSILGIALECGFNSKATFNRVFKNITGQSPSAFKKSQIDK